MKFKKPKFDSLSIGVPLLSISLKLADSIEENIAKEILIRSEDKRFLTSWQCCSSCTKYAIDSIIEYRKFLVDKKIELSKIKDSKLLKIVDCILEQTRDFLSISEKHKIDRDHKYLSEQLDILRGNTLDVLHKLCSDSNIEESKDLFRMRKIKK
jgi:hypothetical protein